MNAIQLILKQHAKIRKFLSRISKTKTQSFLEKEFNKLSSFLIKHERMEQKIWYPFLRKNTKLKSLVSHLVNEEKTAAKAISKIKTIKSPKKFESKLIELKTAVTKHANEEEKKLLPKVGKLIEDDELQEIGKQMNEFIKTVEEKNSEI